MLKNFKFFLWFLKLGALVNLFFLARTFAPPLVSVDAHIVIPARILFTVSTFRCLFPVRYKDNIVFHNSPFSSIFLTRLLATFSEVALIYQLAYLIRLLNVARIGWIDILAWVMLTQVIISQCFVWGSILTGNLKLFLYEELGWALIYSANTIASAYLFATVDYFDGRELLIQLNLIFAAVYLPWQFIHLRDLRSNARSQGNTRFESSLTVNTLVKGLQRSIRLKNQTSDSQAWGGLIGAIWMTAYWATLIPMWVFQIVRRI